MNQELNKRQTKGVGMNDQKQEAIRRMIEARQGKGRVYQAREVNYNIKN